MGVHHWPGCNGNHPLGTPCNGGHSERLKAEFNAHMDEARATGEHRAWTVPEDIYEITRRAVDPARYGRVYILEEDLPAGTQAEVNPRTGMLRRRRT